MNLKDTPENLGDTPENLGDTPENLKDIPENVGDTPENLKDIPENVGDTPENLKDIPENVGDSPENLGDTPENIFFIRRVHLMQSNLNNFFELWDDTGIALFGIALGIIAKFLYEYSIKYLRARNKANVRFDWKGFGLTVLLSGFLAIVMYSGLLSAIAKLENNLLVLSVAAQNGFFWQTIIDKLSEERAKILIPRVMNRKMQVRNLESDDRKKQK